MREGPAHLGHLRRQHWRPAWCSLPAWVDFEHAADARELAPPAPATGEPPVLNTAMSISAPAIVVRRLDALGRGGVELAAGMFGDDREPCSYAAPASCSSANSSAVSFTMMPRCRPARRLASSCALSALAGATPRSANAMVSSGLVLAFMMSGSFTKRGSLRRRSVVTTAGRSTSSVSRPASTSRVTRRLVVGELDLGGERGLRTIPQRREHLPGLVVVVVDRLLAEDDQERLFLLDQLEQHARGGERLERRRRRRRAARGARPWRARCAACAWASAGRDGGDDHFVGAPALLDAQRFFERDLVEGIDAELDAVEHHARAVGLHADAHVVVDDALDCDENSAGLM